MHKLYEYPTSYCMFGESVCQRHYQIINSSMTPLGFIFLSGFIVVWLSSLVLVLVSLPVWLLFGISWPIKVLFIYVIFRLVRPLKPWPELHALLRKLSTTNPYFRTEKLVFESDKAIPLSNSSTMLAVFPHGALCTGWTVKL